MSMKTLLGIILYYWAIQMYRKIKKQEKIIKKFQNGPQTVMIKILKKSIYVRKHYYFFQLDKSVFDLCFEGEVLIDGKAYKATIITSPQTIIGETYILNGYYYPISKLFIENMDNIYGYKIRKYSIAYLFPKAIMYRKPSNI